MYALVNLPLVVRQDEGLGPTIVLSVGHVQGVGSDRDIPDVHGVFNYALSNYSIKRCRTHKY